MMNQAVTHLMNWRHYSATPSESEGSAISVFCPKCKRKYYIHSKKMPRHEKVVARCKICDNRFQIKSSNRKYLSQMDSDSQKAPDTGNPARTIGVIISKGGVGKTTTAVNLSAGLALSGFKVLLVDTDTQGQDSYMLGIKPAAGLSEYLIGEVKLEEAVVKARDNLWVLAGGKSLAGVKRMIDRKDFGGERMLAEALGPLENSYDYIIVDTSPGWDPISVNVLFYVKEILIPVSLEVMSFHGLMEFMKSLSSIQKYRKEVMLKYVLPTFLDKRVNSPIRLLKKLSELYGEYICKPIRYNVSFSEAPAYGQTMYEFAPGSNGTEDYRELVRQVADDLTLLR